jgi:hypothetical protein
MGGAVFNQGGTVVIANSTLTGNTAAGGDAPDVGGSSGLGGGLFNLNGSVTLTNVTIAQNTVTAATDSAGFRSGQAGGGAVYNLSIDVGAVTPTQTATIAVANSILANTAGGSDVVNDQRGGTATINATGPNIVPVAVVNTGGTVSGTAFTTASPKLGALADNGGPTQTMAPRAGSPAINAGSTAALTAADFGGAVPTTDQRGPGFARISDGAVDIGAVEAPVGTPGAKRPVLAAGGSATGQAEVFIPDASGLFANPPAATTPAGLFGGFAGDVRVATGDFNGDGVEDEVLVTGPGTKTVMAVVSGKDGSVLVPPTDPFGDANFTFGGFVTAGDIDGDGKAEWVVTPELSGGPRVVIFHLLAYGSFDITSAGQPSLVANFFGIGDPSFRDGDRPALGDVNGDGILDVFSIAAFNGGPRTALYDGKDVLVARSAGRDPIKLVGDFFAAPSGADEGRGGRSIAVGDVNGDGVADLIATGDNLLGTGNQIVIFSGADLVAGRFPGFGATPIANFTVGGQSPGALISVATVNADGDGRADLAVGSGAGQASLVKVYLGKDLSGTTEPASTFFDPFGTVTTDGVFVG